jgi:hypothetical protein
VTSIKGITVRSDPTDPIFIRHKTGVAQDVRKHVLAITKIKKIYKRLRNRIADAEHKYRQDSINRLLMLNTEWFAVLNRPNDAADEYYAAEGNLPAFRAFRETIFLYIPYRFESLVIRYPKLLMQLYKQRTANRTIIFRTAAGEFIELYWKQYCMCFIFKYTRACARIYTGYIPDYVLRYHDIAVRTKLEAFCRTFE